MAAAVDAAGAGDEVAAGDEARFMLSAAECGA